tara:strand:- start:244 stop:900 length:657 start_codon:yes stop_codon:yes gene_type:complete
MVLPTPFTTQGPANALFNFEDIESGVLYVVYQGYRSETSAAADYHLDANPFHSDGVETLDLTTGIDASFSLTIDVDFDTSAFLFPRTINGDVIINATAGFLFNSPNNVSYKIQATLYIVNDSGATQIGQVVSRTETEASNNSWKAQNFTMPLAISNKLVKEGEWLRLQIEHYAETSGGSGAVDTGIGHSPNNIDGDMTSATNNANYNQTILNIPFKKE